MKIFYILAIYLKKILERDSENLLLFLFQIIEMFKNCFIIIFFRIPHVKLAVVEAGKKRLRLAHHLVMFKILSTKFFQMYR